MPGTDAPKVRQRSDDADRAMSAHQEISDVIEIDHASQTCRVTRFLKQRSNQDLGAPWLIDYGVAKGIMLLSKRNETFSQRAVSQIRPTGDNSSGWFSASVRVDHAYPTRIHL
jgi:hypothetical protein